MSTGSFFEMKSMNSDSVGGRESSDKAGFTMTEEFSMYRLSGKCLCSSLAVVVLPLPGGPKRAMPLGVFMWGII